MKKILTLLMFVPMFAMAQREGNYDAKTFVNAYGERQRVIFEDLYLIEILGFNATGNLAFVDVQPRAESIPAKMEMSYEDPRFMTVDDAIVIIFQGIQRQANKEPGLLSTEMSNIFLVRTCHGWYDIQVYYSKKHQCWVISPDRLFWKKIWYETDINLVSL